jgi:hypothetical protein
MFEKLLGPKHTFKDALLTLEQGLRSGEIILDNEGEGNRVPIVDRGRAGPAGSTIEDLNRDLARRINAEARANPHSPFANKYVGIINGQVAIVGDDLDEVVRRLRQMEPDPRNCIFLEASRDYNDVHEIWDLN